MRGGDRMKRNLIISIVLAILVLQPLIVLGLGPSAVKMDTPKKADSIPAQGIRVAPSSLTNHVPILIDEDADFVSQGWPGAGTAQDPYVISQLNITYDIGQIGIAIYNTDMHFVIEDCYVDQLSTMYAISFVNTSAGSLQYCDITSAAGAIFLDNANTSSITHTVINAEGTTGVSAIMPTNSISCTISDSIINCTAHRSITATYVDGMTIENCVMYPDSSSDAMDIRYTNGLIVNGIEAYNGFTVLDVRDCSDVQASNFYGRDFLYGITMTDTNDSRATNFDVTCSQNGGYINTGHNNNITASRFIAGSHAIYMHKANDSYIIGNELNSTSGNGIWYNTGNDAYIEDNTILHAGQYGIQCDTINYTLLQNNVIEFSVNDGIFLDTCHHMDVFDNYVGSGDDGGLNLYTCLDLNCTGNEIHDVAGIGIYTTNSHEAFFHQNVISDAGTNGFHIINTENHTLTENSVSMTGDTAVYLDTPVNTLISDNIISESATSGIQIMNGHNSDVLNNEITNVGSAGIYVESHDDIMITGNSVQQCSFAIDVASSHRMIVDNNILGLGIRGIDASNSLNNSIVQNTIDDMTEYGMYLWNIDNSTIASNQISNCSYSAIYFGSVNFLNASANTMIGCGMEFYLQAGVNYYNHTLENNQVNSLPLYYGLGEDGESIDANDYGQVILVDCFDMDINDGSFNNSILHIIYSDEVHVDGIDSYNGRYGILVFLSEYLTVNNSEFTQLSQIGIDISYSNNATVMNSEFERCGAGVNIEGSLDVDIGHCVFDHSYTGVAIGLGSSNATIHSSNFTHIELVAVLSEDGSDYCVVEHNYMFNCTYGIVAVLGSDGWNIEFNYLHHMEYGIVIGYVSPANSQILFNELYSSGYGIVLMSASFVDIQNNTILWGEEYGIHAGSCSNLNVTYNTVGLFTIANGYDDTLEYWDDNVDTGNWWADYSGSGWYYLDGGASAADRYPMQYIVTEPVIDSPLDVWLAEGSEGNYIEWVPFDDNLKNFEAVMDGALWAADAWNFTSIKINIDGLPYGDHVLVVTVYDLDGNSVSDEVTIHVYDDTPPTINHPANTEAFVGNNDQTISWRARDLNPDTYIVYRNGTEYASGNWEDNVSIVIDVDGLDEGLWAFKMTVNDVDGNSVSDTILVLVIDDSTPPTINQPNDIIMFAGTTGNNIAWLPSDMYPDYYEIELNGTIVEEGEWGGGSVVYNLDSLTAGVYGFTITVYDKIGQTASDDAEVTVYPYRGFQETTEPPPFDIVMALLIAGGIVGVIAVIGGVYYFRKRRAAN